jgi:hypothetical protein
VPQSLAVKKAFASKSPRDDSPSAGRYKGGGDLGCESDGRCARLSGRNACDGEDGDIVLLAEGAGMVENLLERRAIGEQAGYAVETEEVATGVTCLNDGS